MAYEFDGSTELRVSNVHRLWEPPARARRVEIPAWADDWMRGDRYGDVLGYAPIGGGRFKTRVRLDKSGRAVVFFDCELTDV